MEYSNRRRRFLAFRADKIDPTYRRLRWQVFIGIFLGYAAYYFTRGNFDLAQKGLIDAGLFNKEELGKVGAAAGLAYGISKFLMASISDRANPKYFLPCGLFLSGLCMTIMGLAPWATSGVTIAFIMISSTAGSRAWAGRPVAKPWCTGGRKKNAAPSCPSGTVHTTSVAWHPVPSCCLQA